MPKVTILGAGSVGFTRTFLWELVHAKKLGKISISLMDIDEGRVKNAGRLATKLARQSGRDIRVETTLDRRAALASADYVINVTMIGGLACRRSDMDVPMKYGLQQAIGCTMGPGGVMSGLRSIPFLLDVAQEMQELCPGAVMLNYHNPQSASAQAWSRRSSVKYAGLCHSVPETSRELAGYVGCADMGELDFHVAGINHMAWILRFEWNGKDAYPILRERMKDPEIYRRDRVRFEIFKHFGCFNTESSMHMSEYVPYFRRTDAMIKENHLPVREYVRLLEWAAEHAPKQMKQDLDPNTKIGMGPSDEAAVDIICAMESSEDCRSHVTVVNGGLIANLPAEAGVEVPTVFNRSGIHPEPVGRLPSPLAALNTTNLNVQQVMANAVLEESRELAIQAVMLDPLTASVMKLAEIRGMMLELFEAQANWLPPWLQN